MNLYKYEIEDKFYPCSTQSKWEINPISGVVRHKKSNKIINRYTLHFFNIISPLFLNTSL